MPDDNTEMRCAYLASERGAVVLPSTTDAGAYTIINVLDNAVINADAAISDVQTFCTPVDLTIIED
jgi:hypothetical protein